MNNKTKFFSTSILFAGLSIFLLIGCYKTEEPILENSVPELTTSPPIYISGNTAIVGGDICNNGGSEVHAIGVVYWLPDLLVPNVRKVFVEENDYPINILKLVSDGKIDLGSKVWGIDSAEGEGLVVLRAFNEQVLLGAVGGGINFPGDTLDDIMRQLSSIQERGTGSFTIQLTNLEPKSDYRIMAFTANEFGVVYGNEINFTTSD
jgi:hypothetical protein